MDAAIDEVLTGLGAGVTRVQRKQHAAYQRLRNLPACSRRSSPSSSSTSRPDPKKVGLVPGFTRDMTGLGHHGTGDLELQLRTERDLDQAQDLFRLSYAAA